MQTVSITEFKARFHEPIDKVARTGEPLALTKRGKPLAMVVPSPASVGKRWKLGRFRDDAKIVGDIVTPLDEPWEAPL